MAWEKGHNFHEFIIWEKGKFLFIKWEILTKCIGTALVIQEILLK